MFNKKLKQENRVLLLDNNSLGIELDKVNEELEKERNLRKNCELQIAALDKLIECQGALIMSFAGYITNEDTKKRKRVKIKKGAKHGKKK